MAHILHRAIRSCGSGINFCFGVRMYTYVDYKSLRRAGQDRNRYDKGSHHEHREHPAINIHCYSSLTAVSWSLWVAYEIIIKAMAMR